MSVTTLSISQGCVTGIVIHGQVKSIRQPMLLLGEGNGTPLQYSCLENPMDGGAW